MQEQERCASAPTTEDAAAPVAGAIWADLRCLALLVVLVVAVRAWQITHTEVASRDSISYIRIAWQLEHGPWREVLPSSPQHPGYPLAVLGMSLPVRHFLPDDLPHAFQLSGQLVSALASVLLLVPMFYFGREVFDRRIAFWSCVLFQCLPTSGKIMSDALSDTLFLLFACSGLWLATVALRRRSWWLFALTGLAGALAYLTRPEGALILAATGLVLIGAQLNRQWRQSWRNVLVGGAALTLTALAIMLPYMLVIRGLTVKNTPNIMIHQQRPDADWENRLKPLPPQKDKPQANAAQPGSALLAMVWPQGDPRFKTLVKNIKNLNDLQNFRPPQRYLWAILAMAVELGKGFFYMVWLPALLGLWWFRDRFRKVPGVWVGSLTCLALSGLLYRMTEKMGYLSDRHLLLLILCGIYWAVAGTLFLGKKLALGAARLWPSLAGRRWTDGRAWSLGLLLLFALAPLPRTLNRLHAERAGFRSIGHWLAENTDPGDFIEDPYCWAYYYAGRVFVEGCPGLKMHQPPCFYVVLEESANRHLRLISLPQALEDVLHERRAKMIHEEEVRRGRGKKAMLQVWEVPGPYHWTPLPPLPGLRN
ncbi:MAG TPA: glycosyltransferase family 39 protein [Gemmataceae bacterium]|nr:glycosyltransferase family 39 protein [Gemmataceae bacterium]